MPKVKNNLQCTQKLCFRRKTKQSTSQSFPSSKFLAVSNGKSKNHSFLYQIEARLMKINNFHPPRATEIQIFFPAASPWCW
jgi:hypothetical protein